MVNLNQSQEIKAKMRSFKTEYQALRHIIPFIKEKIYQNYFLPHFQNWLFQITVFDWKMETEIDWFIRMTLPWVIFKVSVFSVRNWAFIHVSITDLKSWDWSFNDSNQATLFLWIAIISVSVLEDKPTHPPVLIPTKLMLYIPPHHYQTTNGLANIGLGMQKFTVS